MHIMQSGKTTREYLKHRQAIHDIKNDGWGETTECYIDYGAEIGMHPSNYV